MLSIVSFTAEWSARVREFNQRLLAGGLDPSLQFFEEPRAEFSTMPEAPVYQEFFLAVEEGVVRGAYSLTQESWRVAGQSYAVANYRLPLSEGLVNAAYRGVSLVLARDALKRQPLLYCLGMGGYDRPLPRTLRAMKWPMFSTPFFFHALRPSRVLRNLTSLRSSPWRRLAFDAAAWSGAGWAALKLTQSWQGHGQPWRPAGRVAPEFGEEEERLWEEVNKTYQALAVRDARVLNLRYPREDACFIRLRVERAGRLLGWAVLLATGMREHKHFGDLRVGTIVDCLAMPEDAQAVAGAAAAELRRRDVDLIVSNQTHAAWCAAFRRAGFLEGPSNRIFAASVKLGQLLGPLAENQGRLHITRGDGVGPIHLL